VDQLEEVYKELETTLDKLYKSRTSIYPNTIKQVRRAIDITSGKAKFFNKQEKKEADDLLAGLKVKGYSGVGGEDGYDEIMNMLTRGITAKIGSLKKKARRVAQKITVKYVSPGVEVTRFGKIMLTAESFSGEHEKMLNPAFQKKCDEQLDEMVKLFK